MWQTTGVVKGERKCNWAEKLCTCANESTKAEQTKQLFAAKRRGRYDFVRYACALHKIASNIDVKHVNNIKLCALKSL